jgi:hypothetical protein
MAETKIYQSLANGGMVVLLGAYLSEFGSVFMPNFLHMMGVFGLFGYYAQNYAAQQDREPAERGIGLLNMMGLLLLSAAYIFHMEHWPYAAQLLPAGLGMMIIVWALKLLYQKRPSFMGVIVPLLTILMIASYGVKTLDLPYGELAYLFAFPPFFAIHVIHYFFPQFAQRKDDWPPIDFE